MNLNVVANPDYRANEVSADEMHHVFLKHGCIVLRGAIDRKKLEKIKRQTDDAFVRLGQPVHVGESDIVASSPNRFFRKLGAYDLVDTPKLSSFRDLAFNGQPYIRQDAVARRIKGRDADTRSWQEPLKLHLDCFYHPFNFTLNFRVPFDPEGDDAPGLQILPVDMKTTCKFSRFNKSPVDGHDGKFNFNHFPLDLLEPAHTPGIYGFKEAPIRDRFGPDCFYRPSLMPGDLMILSNWVIHGTYRTAAMTKGRTSIEIRYQSSSEEIPC